MRYGIDLAGVLAGIFLLVVAVSQATPNAYLVGALVGGLVVFIVFEGLWDLVSEAFSKLR